MENGTMSTQKESVGLSLDTKMPANTTTFPPSAGCVKNCNGEKKCEAIGYEYLSVDCCARLIGCLMSL